MQVVIEVKDGENIIGCEKLAKQLMNIKDGDASIGITADKFDLRGCFITTVKPDLNKKCLRLELCVDAIV